MSQEMMMVITVLVAVSFVLGFECGTLATLHMVMRRAKAAKKRVEARDLYPERKDD